MARLMQDRAELALIRTVLLPLAEVGATLRPGLDERQMLVSVRRAGVSLAKKSISHRDVEKLRARGLVRREPKPSPNLVITLKGEALVRNWQLQQSGLTRPTWIEEITTPAGETRRVNFNESPLLWLSRRKNAAGKPLIDALQFAAGERFRSDFTLAGLSPRMTLDWTRYGAGTSSGIGHPGLATEVMTAARQRLHAALDCLGPAFAGLALDLCCFLKGIGEVERERGLRQRSAKQHLIAALDRLVAHYGLGASGPNSSLSIRVWSEP